MTRDDWLAAIHDAMPQLEEDANAMTGQEFAALRSCSLSTARLQLKQWEEIGKVERVMKPIIDVAGRRLRVPAYRLIGQPKTKTRDRPRRVRANSH